MIESKFTKELTSRGEYGFANAVVIATLNRYEKKVKGTHAFTHDDYERTVGVHTVESFVNGHLWKECGDLFNEQEVLDHSARLLKETREHLEKLVKEKPVKTFAEKMAEVFSEGTGS